MAAVSNVAMGQPSPEAPANPAATQAAQVNLPVKNVVLFSSGVGYFEHYGSVSNDSATELRFKTAQINDILKSLVLQDMDGGKVTTVQYPSQDPVEKTLKSFQVDITGNPPLADLLNQLRGARVTVKLMGESFSGTVLGCEQRQVTQPAPAPAINIWILNLIEGATIRQIELAKVSDVKLEDAQLQEELTRALQALAKARDQEKKSVTINFAGKGDRRVRLGYVVETPVWKTSYRLLFGADDVKLQGWAIVENQTDNDWDNVQLSLVSGRPISFVQDLYQPLYIPRPVVRPQLFASLTPQAYDGGQQEMAKRPGGARRDNRAAAGGFGGAGNAPASMAAPAPMMDMAMKAEEAPMDAASSVQSAASASKLGELFQYTVGNVSLPRQKSAMIPIVTDKVDVEKLSIYNQAVHQKYPLNGAMFTNSTDKHLLQGPITVFDASAYAGDAQIDNVPPGQKRLISYGVDLQVSVIPTPSQTSAIQTGKIVKGVLQLQRKVVDIRKFDIDNKSDKDKKIVIETPINQNWNLVNTAEPMEKTDALYRFKVPVAKGKLESFTVQQETIQGEALELIPCDPGALMFYSKQGEIPEKVRDALAEVAKAKQTLVDFDRQIEEAQQQINTITAEQNRIRENMKTVDRNSQYYNRLLEKLNSQETQIDTLQKSRTDMMEKRDNARRELDAKLGAMNVE